MQTGTFSQLTKPQFVKIFLQIRAYQPLGDNTMMASTLYQLQVHPRFNQMQNPQLVIPNLTHYVLTDLIDGLYLIYHGLFYETGLANTRVNQLMNVFDGLLKTYQNQMTVMTTDHAIDDIPTMEIPSSLESYDAGLSSHGRSVHDSLSDAEIPMLDDIGDENQVDKSPQSLTAKENQTLADYHQKLDIEVPPIKSGLDTTNQKSAFDLIDNTPIEDAKLPQKSAAMRRLNSMRAKRTQISQAPIMSLADLMHHKSSDNIKPQYLSQAHKSTSTNPPIKMKHDIYQTLVKLCPSIEMHNQHQIISAYQSLTKVLDQYHRLSQADDGLKVLFSFNQTYAFDDLKLMLNHYAQQLALMPVNDTWVKLYAQLTAGQLELLAFFVDTLKNDAGMSVNTYQVSVKKQSVNVNYAGHLIGEITGCDDGLKFSFENFDDDLLNHHSFDGMDRQQKPVVKYNKFVNSPKLAPHDFTHQPQYVGAIMQVIAGYVAIGHLYKYYNNGQSK